MKEKLGIMLFALTVVVAFSGAASATPVPIQPICHDKQVCQPVKCDKQVEWNKKCCDKNVVYKDEKKMDDKKEWNKKCCEQQVPWKNEQKTDDKKMDFNKKYCEPVKKVCEPIKKCCGPDHGGPAQPPVIPITDH